MESAGAEYHDVDRGGSVTFHGPGQLVGYPIVDLGIRPDVQAYVWKLEETVIRACADAEVARLGRNDLNAGVWAGDRKVCAIGVRVLAKRVTLHGFALNCTTDLRWFDAIVPCGLADTGVTTLSSLAGREVSVAMMADLTAGRFEDVFGVALEPAALSEARPGVGAPAR
jgi:lipoyl(octanoyl) transferase